jgi:serpin B
LWIVALILVVGCSKNSGPTPPELKPPIIAPPPPVPAADLGAAAVGDTAFAVDLYGRLRAGNDNLIFSPASVSSALAMTYAGAAGRTTEEMKAVLHFTLDPDKLHAVNHKRLYIWNGGDGAQRSYELVVANSLWGQKDENWKPEFLAVLNDRYAAGLRQVDFVNGAEGARQAINHWVEQWTKGKITDLIPTGILTPNTRLVLADAIYFKGDWERKFDADATHPVPFHVSGGQTVRVSTMHQTNYFRYGEPEGVQVLELPYAGRDLSMIVLLPRKRDGLGALEATLTSGRISQLTESLGLEKVIVYLPKFKFDRSLDLEKPLAALGMKTAFDPNSADFSGMNGKRDLFISNVVHKATIEVNEKGSEASAATAVVGVKKSVAEPKETRQAPVFLADHPFLFLIQDNLTGTLLFMGRVVDPSK